MKKNYGLALAATAAALFATAPITASAAESSESHCMGVNACKGQSDCKTAHNACEGKNACKGKGFMTMTEEECAEEGGDFVMAGFLKKGMIQAN
ncbi:MAG: hypothetical protein H0V62_09560 [Gammaproteobacteria bacterium]|nr:hypothetical protein [Gammaproteobacteria bacterium]